MNQLSISTVSRRRFLTLTAGSLAAAPFAIAPVATAWGRESAGLIVHTDVPMNAEPRLPALIQSWQTPIEEFYVRSHAPVPKIDPAKFRLKVTGLVENELSLSLAELATLVPTTVTATMTCAGNRRYEHSRVSPIKGVPWREGAIGNAEWSGVKLSDLLRRAGLREGAEHVWFEGLDEVEHEGGIIPFGASIPLAQAMNDEAEMPGALVCTGMNGQPLTPDHGWPLRTVVPGYIGARSVKWLGKIVVSDRPSSNHFVATAYKTVTEGSPLEWAEMAPIYRYPINSVICTPESGAALGRGQITVSGYALAPGQPGRTIRQVELSANAGKTWIPARITSKTQPYCWQLWSADVPVTAATEEIVVRATDSAGNQQPGSVAWNLKGYLYNAWHRVPVSVTG